MKEGVGVAFLPCQRKQRRGLNLRSLIRSLQKTGPVSLNAGRRGESSSGLGPWEEPATKQPATGEPATGEPCTAKSPSPNTSLALLQLPSLFSLQNFQACRCGVDRAQNNGRL